MAILQNALDAYQATGYVVGGFVRDMLLGKTSDDIDIAVNKNVLEVARSAAGALGGRYILLDEKNKAARVVVKNRKVVQIDFTALKGKTIEEDAARRDFTINAMAIPVNKTITPMQIIDPLNGRADIRQKNIKMTAEKAFSDDPLRVLRAFRLAARLNFKIDDLTLSAMAGSVDKLRQVSGERILEELSKILENKNSCQYIKLADDKVNLWSVLFPRVAEMKNTAQNCYHRDNVWEHSLKTLHYLEKIINQGQLPKDILEEIENKLNRSLAANRSHWVILKLACLLHDVGKTAASTRQGGRIIFYRHEKEGVRYAASFADRVRLSNIEKRVLTLLVENHMRPLELFNQSKVTGAARYRLFKKLDGYIYHCLLLSLADVSSTYASTGNFNGLKAYRDYIIKMFNLVINQREKYVNPPKLVDGSDLKQYLGLRPSKKIGQLLDEITGAQIDGVVKTREEALRYAREILIKLMK
nr:HD domain-containing protein [Desulforadius tongensis]